MPAVEENILGMLDKGVSSVVTKDGEEIVGVVICDVLEITSAGHGHQSSTGQVMPAKFIQLQAFFDDLSTKFGTDNVWDKYEKEESMDICMLCIKQEERHKGLGALLVSQALQTAQDHGIELIHSLALSAFSQAIFEKYGFKTENEISYDTYSQDGEIIFDVSKMDEIHKSGKFMVMAK